MFIFMYHFQSKKKIKSWKCVIIFETYYLTDLINIEIYWIIQFFLRHGHRLSAFVKLMNINQTIITVRMSDSKKWKFEIDYTSTTADGIDFGSENIGSGIKYFDKALTYSLYPCFSAEYIRDWCRSLFDSDGRHPQRRA